MTDRGFRLFEWLSRRIWQVAFAALGIAVALALLGQVVADEGEPDFSPGGPIYDIADRADEVFSSSSPIRGIVFIVENPNGGDVLTRASLLEFKQNSDAVRADAESQSYLAASFDPDLRIEIEGLFSIADAVDDALPAGLEGATDAEVKIAISDLLADGAPTSGLRFLLSAKEFSREPATIEGRDLILWKAPAFFANLLYDFDAFDQSQNLDSFGDDTNLDAERWLRDVQTTLRGDQDNVTAIGVAIDAGLVGEEQNATAGPFIFAAIAFILIFVGALVRSYWAAMVVGAGLGIVMMSYNGVNAVIGLKTGSPLLILVVPIALISFGVDFFIHGSGRAHEFQVEGHERTRAYPLGLTAVFTALLLAALSSAAAFLSNVVSGIQAIIEFGIAAAVALLLSYVVLGLIAPGVLLSIEDKLGGRPTGLSHLRTVGQKIGFVFACFFAGIAVTLAIVFPSVGWIVYLAFLGLFLWLPFVLTNRRNARARRDGAELVDDVRGAGHGFKAAGSVVHFLARWRVITVPAVAVLAVLGVLAAFQVKQGFEIKDFFSSDTDFVRSLDKLDEFFLEGGGRDFIYVEGDLTSPDRLQALDGVGAGLDEGERAAAAAAGTAVFVRDIDGDLDIGSNAVTVARLAATSPPLAEGIRSQTGVTITDQDGNGLPDTAEQVAAAFAYAGSNDLVNSDGVVVFRPDQTETFLHNESGVQATTIAVGITSFTDDVVILAGRDVLEEGARELEENLGSGVTVGVSGDAIQQQDTLDSFTSSMLTSLPVAVLLTVLIVLFALVRVFQTLGRRTVSIAKRSSRYALISIVPILLVVAWIYGFMWLVDYKINVITATIAAIAIGVGIDYSTHFTIRFIEEFEGRGEPSRFPALRRAGEGTGGALAISALTSMTGFLVMAASPMPMFQTFGVLTAVMILFALLVSLLVLPSLLVVVTPSIKGEERQRLMDRITGGEFEYEPHARDTALRRADTTEE